jgi:hypothetical protein
MFCGADLSLYHQWCYGLWEKEILLHSGVAEDLLKANLSDSLRQWKTFQLYAQFMRHQVFPRAANQRIAYTVLKSPQSSRYTLLGPDSIRNYPGPMQDLWVASTGGETCSWVEEQDFIGVYPRFIWNIRNRECIDTESMSFDFTKNSYLCVQRSDRTG